MRVDAEDFGARFDRSRAYYESWLGDLTTDVPAVLEAARNRYTEMGPGLVYANEPGHPMAFSLFTCAALLCLYLELVDRGVDVHDFGARMLRALTDAVEASGIGRTAPDPRAAAESVRSLESAGERSQSAEAMGSTGGNGAFVFDVQWIDEPNGHWSMTMTRCGICHLFGQHGAMDLVPYMCATDDVMSEVQGQGLRRTGTIALGLPQCDFDYQAGRATRPVAGIFPDRIRLID